MIKHGLLGSQQATDGLFNKVMKCQNKQINPTKLHFLKNGTAAYHTDYASVLRVRREASGPQCYVSPTYMVSIKLLRPPRLLASAGTASRA